MGAELDLIQPKFSSYLQNPIAKNIPQNQHFSKGIKISVKVTKSKISKHKIIRREMQ